MTRGPIPRPRKERSMTTDFPTAAEMRAKLNAGQETDRQNQLRRLKDGMETAIAQNKNSVIVYVFAHGVEERLRELGYMIERHSPPDDPREPGPDGPYWTVSW